MADHLEFIEGDKLLKFFHNHKTQLSCSCKKNPMTFVRQLLDKSLISEEIYEKLQNTQDPETDLYEALDWIEKNKRTFIRRFWGCVFQQHIMEEYPTLRELQEKLFNKAGLIVNSKDKDVNTEARSVVEIPVSVCDEEQPGSSSDVTQPRRQGTSSSSVPRETKSNMILVTCGDQQGYMDPNKLKNGRSECILVGGAWQSPIVFQQLGGKERSKNWRYTIYYKNEPLNKYTISNGCLRKKPRRRRKCPL